MSVGHETGQFYPLQLPYWVHVLDHQLTPPYFQTMVVYRGTLMFQVGSTWAVGDHVQYSISSLATTSLRKLRLNWNWTMWVSIFEFYSTFCLDHFMSSTPLSPSPFKEWYSFPTMLQSISKSIFLFFWSLETKRSMGKWRDLW